MKYLTLSSFLLLAACVSPSIENHGFEEVQKNLGSPSATSSFKEDSWYYITRKTTSTAFKNPQTLDHKVVAITFNKAGLVEKIEERTKEDIQKVKPTKEKTPSSGYESGVFRDIFGNFGRIPANGPSKTGQ
jgi:outer membrane protein assembly factor BamE (lipoprotein component of BamABCDE complex)